MAECVLTLNRLSRRVGEKTIVDDVSFDFKCGRIYTILGPSGAGKSSLLRLLNRLDEPTEGEVIFQGRSQREMGPAELRRKIGYLFQTPHLFPGTVVENIRYARPELRDAEVDELARHCHINPELIRGASGNLSIGEQQRVALARLLATDPAVVLLDEPTSALDPPNTLSIEKLIRELVQQDGLTVIMVTHNPEQALRMNGEALLLVGGKLVEHGPVEQIVNDPATEIGKEYRQESQQ